MTVLIVESDDDAVVVTTEPVSEPVATTKIVQFTRAMATASGSQVVTGIGFKPRLILFMSGIGGVQHGSVGVASVDLRSSFQIAGTVISPAQNIAGYAASDATNYQTFVVASFDLDGFTLTWTKTLSPTGTASVTAVCFR